MPATPILLKVLLRQNHWQQYAAFCAQYDKAAQRIDSDLARTFPSRAQLHRWLSGSVRSLPYPDHCRVLEEMFPGQTAEQLFSPCPPDALHPAAQNGHAVPGEPDAHPGLPALSTPSIGIRPFIERAFTREHVSIDFAGFSGETLHGVTQEPLDKIRLGHSKPKSLAIRLLLPDTTRPMVLPCRTDDLADDPDYRDRAHSITTRHARAISDTVQELTEMGMIDNAAVEIRAHPARRCSSSTSSTAKKRSSASTRSSNTTSSSPAAPAPCMT
ncbi:MAG TPA: hypothetical protein VMV92_28895 [Streptosporangiaceae bacterium]|nr:hypothetical protein [Streptosporangiaceae bacterium]